MPAPKAAPKLPARVRIGALDYTVKPWSPMAADNTSAYGMCDRSTCVILIREDLVPQKMAEVLVHEVLHACYHGAGLVIDEGISEERIVLALALQWVQVLRDNPALLSFILEVFP